MWSNVSKMKKKCCNMQFAFILNGFGQKIHNWRNRVFKYGLNIWLTLSFAENGQITYKKGIEKLS